MGRLMKAEFYKLQKFPSVRLIFLLTLVVGMLRGFSPCSGYQVYTIGLVPELFDIVLVSVFTSTFLCSEFSRRTFGNAVLCGTSRQNVFLAKLAVYFPALLVLILLPLVVSTSVATMRNGFGADPDVLVLEMTGKLLFYICHRFSMAGFAILVASVIRNSIGMLGISMAGMYLMSFSQNFVKNLLTQDDTWTVSILKTIILLSAAIIIFIRRDLK